MTTSEPSKKYVIVYAKPVNHDPLDAVLLVLKDRPEWQKGFFNLVGGKIESGETPIQAAVRELKEESGLDPAVNNCEKICGKIIAENAIVYCIKIPVFYDAIASRSGETETVAWMDWNEMKNHELLIPNLNLIIPLMINGVENWTLTDINKENKYDYEITWNLTKPK